MPGVGKLLIFAVLGVPALGINLRKYLVQHAGPTSVVKAAKSRLAVSAWSGGLVAKVPSVAEMNAFHAALRAAAEARAAKVAKATSEAPNVRAQWAQVPGFAQGPRISQPRKMSKAEAYRKGLRYVNKHILKLPNAPLPINYGGLFKLG